MYPPPPPRRTHNASAARVLQVRVRSRRDLRLKRKDLIHSAAAARPALLTQPGGGGSPRTDLGENMYMRTLNQTQLATMMRASTVTCADQGDSTLRARRSQDNAAIVGRGVVTDAHLPTRTKTGSPKNHSPKSTLNFT